jgi:hypothetical protein
MAVNSAVKQRRRGLGRPFQKGQSGNPHGRPVGSRNRATQLGQGILDDNAEAIFEKLVELSLAGREAMLKLAAERIVPRRARTTPFALPEIRSAADLMPAMAAIARAVSEGIVTPFEAAELARLAETALRAAEIGDFERRLADLERQVEEAVASPA